jgi:hypothetical protein
LALNDSFDEGRLRSTSSPVSPNTGKKTNWIFTHFNNNVSNPILFFLMFISLDEKDGVKPRATSLLASPTSGSEANTPTTSFGLEQYGDSAGTPTGAWSAFSSSSKRQSKQARQVARQTELKRYDFLAHNLHLGDDITF